MNYHFFPDRFARFLDRRFQQLGRAGKLPGDFLPPSERFLRRVLETTYLASQTVDEGRQVRFVLAVNPPTHVWRSGPIPNSLYESKFKKSRDYTVQELRKLAPCTDFGRSAIVIRGAAGRDDDGMCISGVLLLGSFKWDHIYGRGASYFAMPAALFIVVQGPGNILVHVGGTVVAELRGGNVRHASKPISKQRVVRKWFWRGVYDLWELLTRPKPGLPRTLASKHIAARWLLGTVEELVAEIARMGHGGTLVFIRQWRQHSSEDQFPDVRMKYRPEGFSDSHLHIGLFLGAEKNHGLLKAHKVLEASQGEDKGRALQELRTAEVEANFQTGVHLEAVTFAASLCAADGAVILGDSLRIYGWGAELCANPSVSANGGFTKLSTSGRSTIRTPPNIERDYGTRHRSAARYTASNRDSLCIVVSHDGAAKVFINEGGRLFVLDDVQTSETVS